MVPRRRGDLNEPIPLDNVSLEGVLRGQLEEHARSRVHHSGIRAEIRRRGKIEGSRVPEMVDRIGERCEGGGETKELVAKGGVKSRS